MSWPRSSCCARGRLSCGFPFLVRGWDRALCAQLRDDLSSEAQFAQNLVSVLADLRSAAWSDLLLLVQAHRAVDRQARLRAAIVDGHEDAVSDELWVAGDF